MKRIKITILVEKEDLELLLKIGTKMHSEVSKKERVEFLRLISKLGFSVYNNIDTSV